MFLKITDVIEQAQHEGVDILAVPLGGGNGPYPDAYSVTLKVNAEACATKNTDSFFFAYNM